MYTLLCLPEAAGTPLPDTWHIPAVGGWGPLAWDAYSITLRYPLPHQLDPQHLPSQGKASYHPWGKKSALFFWWGAREQKAGNWGEGDRLQGDGDAGTYFLL